MQCDREFPGGPVVRTPHLIAGDSGLIPSQETKILKATQQGQKTPQPNKQQKLKNHSET